MEEKNMNNNIDRAKIIFICIVAAFIIFVISLASTYIKYEKKNITFIKTISYVFLCLFLLNNIFKIIILKFKIKK